MEEKTYFSYFTTHSVDTKFIENTKKYKEKVDIFHPNFVLALSFKHFIICS